ncbi:AAA family ATPase [Trueperella pecoris]|uniref:AAA family ATPase n=1 Tax=Trueperella pecoris TaxID=2733571 RepID=UPI001ABDE51A|nr:hypothetical protein [Trueperella pecoris]QTG75905.1 hypothetical protein J4179_02250 [Trueperella pecoris]
MILLCLPSHLDDAVVRGLAAYGQEGRIARRCGDLAEVLAGVEAGLGDVVLLSGEEPLLDLSLVSQLRREGAMVGVVPGSRPAKEVEALGAIVVAETDMVAFVRGTISDGQTAAQPPRGKIVAVWGPGGSTGRSALVRDLAAICPDVMVVDGDTQRPSLTQMYGLEETSAIVALARHIERGKDPQEILDSVLVDLPGRDAGRPGRLLAGLNTGERWRELPRVVVERMWQPLAGQAQTVLIDLAGGMESRPGREDRHALTRSALEAADVVLHVGWGSPVGLRRFVEHLDSVGTDRPGMHRGVVVLSEHGLGMGGRAKVAELLAGAPMACHLIRGDRRRAEQCELEGRALTQAFPRSGYSKDVAALWRALELEATGSRG